MSKNLRYLEAGRDLFIFDFRSSAIHFYLCLILSPRNFYVKIEFMKEEKSSVEPKVSQSLIFPSIPILYLLSFQILSISALDLLASNNILLDIQEYADFDKCSLGPQRNSITQAE